MATITLLHWNIEQSKSGKYNGANKTNYINYIASSVKNVNADIFTIVEVTSNIAANFVSELASAIYATEDGAAENPWRAVTIDSGRSNESYVIMYRMDRFFHPVTFNGSNVVDAEVPDNGLINTDTDGNIVPFPAKLTASGGRNPCYATFRATDTDKLFSVVCYHAMAGNFAPVGIKNLPRVSYITQFNQGDPIPASFISGDFNVDFQDNNQDYKEMLEIAINATNEKTTLISDPLESSDPFAFRKNAYDNIFLKAAGTTPENTGKVIDLLVESAIVEKGVGITAAQRGTGYMANAAAMFNAKVINENLAAEGKTCFIKRLPPLDMSGSRDFVYEAISSHYPVLITTII